MELLERLRRLLSGNPDVVEKRMVGGRSFSTGGRMFCGVTSSGLMVRLGSDAVDSALGEPQVTRMSMGGRSTAAFVIVAAEGVETEAALATWVRRGLRSVAPELDAVAAESAGRPETRDDLDSPAPAPDPNSASDQFDDLAGQFADVPGVTLPGQGDSRGFGSSALRVGGAIFAMLTRDRLVVKLPRARVAQLIGSGLGEPFTAGKSTQMKEWLTVVDDEPSTWVALAREAFTFVSARPTGR